MHSQKETMNKSFKRVAVIACIGFSAAMTMTACSKATPEDKIKTQITERVHALNADERLAAQTNAKQFFEKAWPVKDRDGSVKRESGFFNECRPSDSNSNGLVTCFGKVPNINGGFEDVKRYCGYHPELVGCSDDDTIK